MNAKVITLRVPDRPTMDVSDETLLAGCARLDARALEELFRRNHREVYRFLCRLLGRHSPEIDDLVQKSFLVAWERASKFRGESNVRAWLFGIAANLARRHQRGEQRRLNAFLRLSQWIPRAEPPHELAIGRRQLIERLSRALPLLPHDLRVAFVMCEIEEVPGVEAARVLGIRPGTIWKRLYQARQLLRKEIEGGGR